MQTKSFIRIPLFILMALAGYKLSTCYDNSHSGTAVLFRLWGYLLILVAVTGFAAHIKNNYFTKSNATV